MKVEVPEALLKAAEMIGAITALAESGVPRQAVKMSCLERGMGELEFALIWNKVAANMPGVTKGGFGDSFKKPAMKEFGSGTPVEKEIQNAGQVKNEFAKKFYGTNPAPQTLVT